MNCCSKLPLVFAGLIGGVAVGMICSHHLPCCDGEKGDAARVQSVAFQPETKKTPSVPAKEPPKVDPDMAAMMALGQPGEEHKKLQSMVGTWDADCKFFTPGQTEPMAMKGVMVHTSVLGGRFLREEFSGDMPEMGPFNGIGYLGFDNTSKKYASIWMDSFSTSIATMLGDFDAKTKTITSTGTNPGPDGKPQQTRYTTTLVDNDTTLFKMFVVMPDGKDFLNGEITYHRRK